MAVLFVAQAIGIELSFGEQAARRGLVRDRRDRDLGRPRRWPDLVLIVLKTVKLPEESVNAVVPFLLSVDWVLGRCRSTTNVASDMLVAVLLDRLCIAGGRPEASRLEESGEKEGKESR